MKRPAAAAHSISCTDREWEQARARAARRGVSISRYLVERGLTANPSRPGEAALHEMNDRLGRILERTLAGTDPDSDVMDSLRRAVSFLVDATMRDMVGAGRGGELREILEGLFGADEAAAILERFSRRRG